MTKQKKLLEYFKGCINYTNGTNTINDVLNDYIDTMNWKKCTIENIKDWLLGLPSCLNIAFSYYDISLILKDCGYKSTTDQDYQDKYYWTALARFIYEAKKYK